MSVEECPVCGTEEIYSEGICPAKGQASESIACRTYRSLNCGRHIRVRALPGKSVSPIDAAEKLRRMRT
ncbi:MAG TPA: hypothetical protein VLX91_05285 [Candidatus Acidoferrales bacterium]|nr:hypothetical protein [Candidatus Acidoferrales bacterium]